MINIVSFSGGRTSAYLVHLMEQKRASENLNVKYVFMDTGAEHPKTYEFIRNVVRHWNIDLVCLRLVVNPKLGNGNSYRVMNVDEICADLQPWVDACGKYGTPYVHGAFCTRTMKLEPFERYCKENYPDGYHSWLGIRADEPRRLKPRDGVSYLADISDFDKQDILDWWKEQPFDLAIPEHLGNCVFCIKKGINKIALAARDEPEMAAQFREVISSDTVRVVERRQQENKIMYRGNNSLESIIAMFSDQTRDDIAATIRGTGGYDSGSCSESCEALICDAGEVTSLPGVAQTNNKPESTGIPMSYQLIGGRCEHALKNLPDNSVDSIVTDPPYGIGFMSNKWDYAVPTVEQWAECLRVLKPGGHLLAFGGSRTYHRLVVNIEDAGFEIRDQIMWIYGSGFPKSKNLDGEHKGKGTALKPAHEPIVMARKPLSATILDNVTEYGTGALNIDLCRVPTEEMLAGGSGGLLSDALDGKTPAGGEWTQNNEGRWPANVIHDGSDEVITAFPDAKGQQGKARNDGSDNGSRVYGALENTVSNPEPRTESATSAARFFYCAKVSKSDRDAGMNRFVAASASEMTGGRAEGSVGINNPRAGAGRTSGAKNTHPTVKPVDLMRYLCRLVTPSGGTVLDPFMGSGSTGKAAIAEGFRFIGIEMDPDHLVTAAARIGHAVKEMEKTGEAA